MTPRTEIEAIPVGIGREDLLRSLATTPARPAPGVRRIARQHPRRHSGARPRAAPRTACTGPFDIRPLIRPVLTVPESRGADDLLEDMRKAGRSLAVVVDEYGGTAGIVTLGDLMRALVGRIDEESTVGGPAGATAQPDGSLLVDGLMRVHELEELLGTELDEAERGDVATVGGLIMARLDQHAAPRG